MKILLVEDNKSISDNLKYTFNINLKMMRKILILSEIAKINNAYNSYLLHSQSITALIRVIIEMLRIN